MTMMYVGYDNGDGDGYDDGDGDGDGNEDGDGDEVDDDLQLKAGVKLCVCLLPYHISIYFLCQIRGNYGQCPGAWLKEIETLRKGEWLRWQRNCQSTKERWVHIKFKSI